MTRGSTQVTSLGFTAACLACWLLMFAAGTDIWHDTGRLDVRTLGATSADVRAFAVAFYGLFFVLLGQFAVALVGFVRARRTGL
jgi:TRAP-type C4-dicarboxylate transport system permease small subunit